MDMNQYPGNVIPNQDPMATVQSQNTGNPFLLPPGAEDVTITNFYEKSVNPLIALIFAGLKILPLIIYFFVGLIFPNDGILMMIVMFLSACDFWFTKNIAGRVLVGLRWWTAFSPEKQLDVWRFETKNEIKEPNADRITFWTGLYALPAVWAAFAILSLITFKFMWVTFCLILLGASLVNTYAYFRCSKIQQKGMQIVVKNLAKKYGQQNPPPGEANIEQ